MRTLTILRYLNNGWLIFISVVENFSGKRFFFLKLKSTPDSISFENVEQTLLYIKNKVTNYFESEKMILYYI